MRKKKILVVDDESDMRIFVSAVVETMGFEPITARDGAEALEKARSHLPDLVVLDVMMPKIDDGIQTFEQFKTNQRFSDIPIIILSAIAKKTFVHSIRMLRPRKGAQVPDPEAYMEKPPDAGELSELISGLLHAK